MAAWVVLDADEALADDACSVVEGVWAVSLVLGVVDVVDEELVFASVVLLVVAWLVVPLARELLPLREPCMLQVPTQTITAARRATATAAIIAARRLDALLFELFRFVVAFLVAVFFVGAESVVFLAGC